MGRSGRTWLTSDAVINCHGKKSQVSFQRVKEPNETHLLL